MPQSSPQARDQLSRRSYDAIVIGAGPNGLSAAITIAQAGRRVAVLEAGPTPGGGTRSKELTLPGFVHDVCSAIHPLGVGSPFFRTLPLAQHGLEWIEPPLMMAHPFDDGTAAVVGRSVEWTASQLKLDGAAYRALMSPLVEEWSRLEESILGPLRWPRHPLTLARFGLKALQTADRLVHRRFVSEAARALFAGIAAHGMLPLDVRPSAAFGLVLGVLAHVVGWVLPRGGTQSITNALAAHFRSLGGEIVTSAPVK